MKTYAQAKKVKGGWKYADEESMCAAVADLIAGYNALNAKCVYGWIRKHYGADWKKVKDMRLGVVPYHDLVGAILNDEAAG